MLHLPYAISHPSVLCHLSISLIYEVVSPYAYYTNNNNSKTFWQHFCTI